MSGEYTCDLCHGLFYDSAPDSEERAWREYRARFGDPPLFEEVCSVCDECHQKLSAWLAAEGRSTAGVRS